MMRIQPFAKRPKGHVYSEVLSSLRSVMSEGLEVLLERGFPLCDAAEIVEEGPIYSKTSLLTSTKVV